MEGDWEYISDTPDKVYGEPEALYLSIRVNGPRLCGAFMSAYRGGMKVAEGEFIGNLSASKAMVRYDPGWAKDGEKGRASLRMNGERLKWTVTRPGAAPDYMVHSALLHRAQPRLDAPKLCK